MSSTNTNAEISSNNSPNPGPSNSTEPSTGESATNPKITSKNEVISTSFVSKIITIRRSTSQNLDNNLGSQTNILAENSNNNSTNESVQNTADISRNNNPPDSTTSTNLDTIANGVPNLNNNQSNNQNSSSSEVENTANQPQTTTENVIRRPMSYGRTSHTIASFPLELYQNPSSSSQQYPSSTNHAACQSIVHTANKPQRCYRAETEVIITAPPFTPHVINGPPPLAGAPPSYSAIMHLGPAEYPPQFVGRPPIRIQPSPPFIAPIPPPSYAEVQGYSFERPTLVASVDQMVWGPDPLSVVCPRCANVVVTSTESQRSNLTHFSALALCLCGCWPCCLLPYCMNSCKNTYHTCPSCQQFLGMYRPW